MRTEKRKMLLLAFSFATGMSILGLFLLKLFGEGTIGNSVFYPGLAVVELYRKIYQETEYPSPWFVLIVSWLFYFAVFYVIARWRARRTARRTQS